MRPTAASLAGQPGPLPSRSASFLRKDIGA